MASTIPDLTGLESWLEERGRRHKPEAIASAARVIGCSVPVQRLIALWNSTDGPHDSPDPVECLLLYVLASRVKGPIFELGCWKARSTCFLAYAAPGRVTTLDWFIGDQTGGRGASRREAEAALRKNDLTATIVEEDMLTASPDLARGAELIFYDSDHSFDPTVKAMSRFLPQFSEGAIIVFHDADLHGTERAIAALDLNHIVTLPVWEGLAICSISS